MGRHTHHRACSVVSQDIVRNPQRQLGTVQRIDHAGTDGHATLGTIVTGAVDRAESRHVFAEGLHRGFLFSASEAVDQLVFRRKHHVTRTSQGVWSGGEHGDGLI